MNRIIKEKKSVEQCSADFFKYQEFLRNHGLFTYRIPIIHIAGTNGKGTVTKMLGKVLGDQGFKVGVFTSPDFVSI